MAGTRGAISGELISLEIRSPDVPDLTLIDLPGIARVAVGDQPKDIGEQVKLSPMPTCAQGHFCNLPHMRASLCCRTVELLCWASEPAIELR